MRGIVKALHAILFLMDIYSIGKREQLAVLQEPALPVEDINDKINTLAKRMIHTMNQASGIGLASPQVGYGKRMFVVKLPEQEPVVFINPQITATSEKQSAYEEGCLSIEGQFGLVKRPAEIEIQAWNLKSKPINMQISELFATVIQHEMDHLNGILFIDYLNPKKRSKILESFSVKDYNPRVNVLQQKKAKSSRKHPQIPEEK